MASRTEKQKTTYYDHFAKKWRCDSKRKRIWLSYLKKSANKKYRKNQKEISKNLLDNLD